MAHDPSFSATGLVSGLGIDVLIGLASGFSLDARSIAGTYTVAVTGSLPNLNDRVGIIAAGTYTIN